MQHTIKSYAPVAARVLLATLFLMSGAGKILSFGEQVRYAATALPFPELAIIVSIFIEIGCGLMLLLGYRARVGAAILCVFTLLVTLAFHRDISDPVQQVEATKNLAIMGGLLLLMMEGAGPVSFDEPDIVV